MKKRDLKGGFFVNHKITLPGPKLLGGFLLLALSLLFMIKFVSAQFFGSYGGQFSLANFFDSLDPSTVVYGLLFFILFTFILLALTRINIFKGKDKEPNAMAAATVSFSISALIVYYLYRSGYNIENFFYELGFSVDLFSLLLAVLVILVAIFVIIKFKFPGFLIVSGFFVMFISIFTELIYESSIAFFIGLGLAVIGIFISKKVRGHYAWGKEKSQLRGGNYIILFGFLIVLLGILISHEIIMAAGAIAALIGLLLRLVK